jgi:hypothetical protein
VAILPISYHLSVSLPHSSAKIKQLRKKKEETNRFPPSCFCIPESS